MGGNLLKVAFELQPLFSVMTGIGFSTQEIIKNLELLSPGNFEIEGLYFNFLGRHKGERIKKRFNFKKVEKKWLPRSFYMRYWKYFPLSYNQIFRTNPDIFHFFSNFVPYRVKGKVVVTVHDLLYLRYPEAVEGKYLKIFREELQRSLDRADRIIAVSEFTKKEIIDYFKINPEKIVVVYNGVDTEKFKGGISHQKSFEIREKYNLPENFFLHVGTLQPRKNLERLVEAYYEYGKQKDSESHLVLAGAKWHKFEGVFKKIRDFGLEGEVHFIGYVEEKDKPYLYKLARALVFPSFYEGFGIPPLEAMATGIPVLASRSSAIPEVVGDAAYLFDPYSIGEITRALIEISRNKSLAEELVQKGRIRCELFSWEKSAEKILGIYNNLMVEGDKNG